MKLKSKPIIAKKIRKLVDVETYIAARLNFKVFAEEILGRKYAKFHEEWIKAMNLRRNVCIAAPRGHGKTDFFGFAFPLWIIWAFKNKEIAIISNDWNLSQEILNNLRTEIMENPNLKHLKPRKGTWSKDKVTTTTGCKIHCRTYSDAISGIHVDYALCDEVSLYKDKEVFYKVILPIIETKRGVIACVGTPKTYVDLIQELRDPSKGFWWKKYQAIIKNEKGEEEPLWKEKFSLEQLYAKKMQMGAGNFEGEYMCNPIAVERRPFKPNDIAEANATKIDYSYVIKGTCYIGVDVAYSATGDYTVITVVDSLKNKKSIIRRIDRFRGMKTRAQVERIKKIYENYKPATVIVDSTGCSIGKDIVQELLISGITTIPADFTPKNRESFLTALATAFENKLIVIPSKGAEANRLFEELKKELLSFTVTKSKNGVSDKWESLGRHDDIVMSLGLAIYYANRFLDQSEFKITSTEIENPLEGLF